jgi:bifunctional N-acetylglucosamine-1-phosphate-uridyltransferase/glucosamine-1-phosphate-acetyltransferase GlmU-like protein
MTDYAENPTDQSAKIMQILQDRKLKVADKVQAIMEEFEGDDRITSVVVGRRPLIVTEVIEVYGLEIGLDANGEASEVRFPNGAHAEEWS